MPTATGDSPAALARQDAAARAFAANASGKATVTVTRAPDRNARAASDLAVLVAHESARAEAERRRREAVELTASELAILVAHEHAELARERSARERAEAEAAELRKLISEKRPPRAGRRERRRQSG